MKFSTILFLLLIGSAASTFAQSRPLSWGMRFGFQRSFTHFYHWGHYTDDDVRMKKSFHQGQLSWLAGFYGRWNFRPGMALQVGCQLDPVTLLIEPNPQNVFIVNFRNWGLMYYRRNTLRVSMPIGLHVTLPHKMSVSLGMTPSVSTIQYLTAYFNRDGRPGADRIEVSLQGWPLNMPDITQPYWISWYGEWGCRVAETPRYEIRLVTTVTYDQTWSLPVYEGINYRLWRVGLGLELSPFGS